MIVTFFDAGIDAAHVDLSGDGRMLWMLAFEIDFAVELCKFPAGRAQELVNGKTDGRARRIEAVSLAGGGREKRREEHRRVRMHKNAQRSALADSRRDGRKRLGLRNRDELPAGLESWFHKA